MLCIKGCTRPTTTASGTSISLLFCTAFRAVKNCKAGQSRETPHQDAVKACGDEGQGRLHHCLCKNLALHLEVPHCECVLQQAGKMGPGAAGA